MTMSKIMPSESGMRCLVRVQISSHKPQWVENFVIAEKNKTKKTGTSAALGVDSHVVVHRER
jgi:hypothetical protein